MPRARLLRAGLYPWRNEYSGMNLSDAKRLKAVGAESPKLEMLSAKSSLEHEARWEALRNRLVPALLHREPLWLMQAPGLTERGCSVIGDLSARTLRYWPRPDRNVARRLHIGAPAQQFGLTASAGSI